MGASHHLGRGLSLVAIDEDGVELEGTRRLSPGRVILLFGVAPAPARGRRAYVSSWRVVQPGSGGLLYRGYCEWVDNGREAATPEWPADQF